MGNVIDQSSEPEVRELLGEAEPLAPSLIHEMRHPLMGALAAERFLEKALGPVLANHEDWALLKGQLARLQELLESYQAFFHPEQRAGTHFTAQPIIGQAIELLGYRLRRLGKRFSTELPQTPIELQGAPAALLHALTNLLLNALDAIDESGQEGRLQVRALRSPSGGAEIRVSDEGAGISETVAARLFERGFTTKGPGKGSGLGLTVARRMVAACGGSLALVKPGEPGRVAWAHTEFCIEMAGAPAPQPPVAAASEKGRTESPAAGAILAVDDEPVIAQLLQRALAEAKLDGVVVSNAEEALRLLKSRHFDLLVTDKNLPGANGVELAESARKLDPGIGVILITAYASGASARRALRTRHRRLLDQAVRDRRAVAAHRPSARAAAHVPARRAAPAPPNSHRVVVVEHDTAFHDASPACSSGSAARSWPRPDVLGGAARHSSSRHHRGFGRALLSPEASVSCSGCVSSSPGSGRDHRGALTRLSDTMAAIGLGAHGRISRPSPTRS